MTATAVVVAGSTGTPSPPAELAQEGRLDCDNTDADPFRWTRRELVVAAVGAILVGAATLSVIAAPGPGLSMSVLQIANLLILATIAMFAVGAVGNGEGYLAGIWLTSTLSPWMLAIVTVIAYIMVNPLQPGSTGGPPAPPDIETRLRCIYVGVAAALAFLAATGFVGRSVSGRSRAQAHFYDQLRDRRSQLRDRHTRLNATRDQVEPTRLVQFDTLWLEAASRLEAAERELCNPMTGRPALRWARATGYSNILRTLHRVEEMILAAQPDEAVIGDAFNDYLSLTGSTIAERETLIANLRVAAYAICGPAAETFLKPAGPATRPSTTLPSKETSREVLREVRFAINDFRDSRVDHQIGNRNSLVLVILAGAAVTYLTLGMAILAGVSTLALMSASIYFLVAAVAGLLNRLRIESGRTTAVEDYGLGIMRLVAAPLLSGLAGVGGVYLIAKSPELFTALFSNQTPPQLTATQVFDVTQNELGLVVAVIFGFAPAAFFASVQRQADRYQQELEKTEPSGGSTLSGNATT